MGEKSAQSNVKMSIFYLWANLLWLENLLTVCLEILSVCVEGTLKSQKILYLAFGCQTSSTRLESQFTETFGDLCLFIAQIEWALPASEHIDS